MIRRCVRPLPQSDAHPGGRAFLLFATIPWLCLAVACERSPVSTGRPRESVSARILQPAQGDTVAVEILVRATVRAATEDTLAFSVDGRGAGVLVRPLWEGRWAVDSTTPPRRVLLALSDRDGTTLDTLTVIAVPDRRPAIVLQPPRASMWVERTPETAIEAVAVDPEEGRLDGSRIRWTVEGSRRELMGPSLPVQLLAERRQQVRAVAIDRFGATGEAALTIVPFHYAEDEDAGAAMDDLARAICARDTARIARMLDPSFQFLPCAGEAEDAAWPLVWSRPDFLSPFRHWISAPEHAWLDCSYLTHLQALWQRGDTTYAFITWEPFTLYSSPPPPAAADSILCGTHDCLLQRVASHGWRIRLWRERSEGSARSLASSLAAVHGWAVPSPAARCGRTEAGFKPPAWGTPAADGSRSGKSSSDRRDAAVAGPLRGSRCGRSP